MSSFSRVPLLPNHCYKLSANGMPVFEALLASQTLFSNPALMHTVLAQTATTTPVMNSWTTAVMKLPQKSIPLYQIRLVSWIGEPWLILTMNMRQMYSLAVHVDEWDHELAEAVPERMNRDGFLELFPFRGPNFRTLRQSALKFEMKRAPK